MRGCPQGTEPVLERLIFDNRPAVLLLFFLATLFLGAKALEVKVDAGFEKMIPLNHPFIQNMMAYRDDLESLGNSVRIAVAVEQGTIFTAQYMELVRNITDELFYFEGVDRAGLKSLWTPNVRWTEVTEEGFAGGPVIPQSYSGDAQSLEQLHNNILKSGQVGRLVANDFRSSIIYVPLFEKAPETGEKIDYRHFSNQLEEHIREKYEGQGVTIHIVGYAKIFGDLFAGVEAIAWFFLLAIIITCLFLWLYSRCIRSTLIALGCSLIAVLWQFGLLATLGFGLDLYSVLVPFLVFAIAVSHGVQVINSIDLELAANTNTPLQAARNTFRILYIPGMLALASDALGFMTLLIIDIGVIQGLAITASIGVGVVILTNLVLLPVLISYSGVNRKAVESIQLSRGKQRTLWHFLAKVTHPVAAGISLLLALGIGFVGSFYGQQLKIGDLDAGAPELRADSRYNRDNAYLSQHYSTSADIMVVMAQTENDGCFLYHNLNLIDQYMWGMENTPGVESAVSLVTVAKQVIKGLNEGNPKWQTLVRNQYVLNSAVSGASGLYNSDCSMAPVLLFLADHKADTLARVVKATEDFISEHPDDHLQLKLAAGNAGVEAAVNQVIAEAQEQMLLLVYGAVSLLCLITFRSVRAVLCIIPPLMLTSVLCQGLMATLGIGVKVATLPVIALGVGIGVDYGIYIYSRLSSYLQTGMTLEEAYLKTLQTTGKAVSFTGITLAIGVGTWIFSPIKFQADMGILLTFMFILNMVGALWLIPALARFVVCFGRSESNKISV